MSNQFYDVSRHCRQPKCRLCVMVSRIHNVAWGTFVARMEWHTDVYMFHKDSMLAMEGDCNVFHIDIH